MTTIEVFADVACPFTHIGLRRFVQRRQERGRDEVVLRVRAWPLEIVNGRPLDPAFVAEEVDELRDQLGPELFAGFTEDAFPRSSMPALSLAAAAYEQGEGAGEAMSLRLRECLFEQGVDIAEPPVLEAEALRAGIDTDHERNAAAVLADHAEGVRRGVIGSPHFFAPSGDLFCPALDVSRDEAGRLHVVANVERFEEFLDSCFV